MTVVLDLIAICICLCVQFPGQRSGTGGRARTCEEEWRPRADTASSACGSCCGIRGKVIQSFAIDIGENCLRLALYCGCGRFDHDGGIAIACCGWGSRCAST